MSEPKASESPALSEFKQFKLPDVGEGLTEADIVKWHVQPGDKVTINQIIVEIETAKAVVELPCPFEGVVSELLVAEGTTVDVGAPIVSVQVGEPGAAPSADAPPAALAVTDAVPGTEAPAAGGEEAGAEGGPEGGKRQAVLVGYGVKLGRTTRRARKGSGPAPAGPGREALAAPVPAPAPSAPAAPANGSARAVTGAGETGGAGGRALAKPPVRKLAKDLGVDLGGLTGSGPQGSITRDDVQQAAAGPAPETGARVSGAGLAGAAAGPREERVPIRGVRKHTAAAVIGSAFTAPHVTEFLQIDVTGTMEALARIRELPEFADLRVSPLLLAARALIVAVGRHPMINSTWDEQAQEIVVHRYVNLGIAAATGRGLVVPNVKDAHALSLPDLARALGELAQTARAGKASQADLRDGTITVTNVGVFGVDSGTPILTPGEAAILALGQIRDLPWVHQGELAIRKVTTLALSFDHRIVDGDLGSAVLRDVGAMLEDPLRMLAWT
ncbi:MAG TPA: dihydrolipoamide acetyltransferase family protein [Streptosporangiaceae bacterium]|nr:dihydrolipoamide acetyltransferase family protein [Streptosporangiaceae bacterium]